MSATVLAAASPAGGAPVGQVVLATAGATVVVAVLLLIGMRRRAGRSFAWLDAAERLASAGAGGVPGWAALPVTVATVSLIGAVFGLQWDVALHSNVGRDEGPLANPSHYFILAGLLGIFAAGWLAVVLPREKPGPAAVRITEGWYAPIGGLAMMGTAGFALAGFPLDDVWHRLFGQDVTLWGPTHLIMLTGAATTLVGMAILLVEGRLARRSEGTPVPWRWPIASHRMKLVLLCGGLLVGLSIFQDEFDYGIPQFRLLFHPVLIALAASAALVAARLLGGRGAALGAVAFFLVVRGIITVLVDPVLGESTSHFPLYLAEALAVEGAALALGTTRAWRFAVVAGALVGSAGTLAEHAWTQVWFPVAWPAHLLPSAIALAVPVGVAGAVLGAFFARSLRLQPGGAVRAAAAAVGIGAVILALLPTSVPDARATVTLTEAGTGASGRLVDATVRVDPPSAVADADWLRTIAWQGGRDVEGAPLRRTGPGTYVTTEPLPVGGTWKSIIRYHRGSEMASVPVFMPADEAIEGAVEVPATPRFERPFVADSEVLQRERLPSASGALWTGGIAAVAAMIVLLFACLAVGLVRLARLGHAARAQAAGASAEPAAQRTPAHVAR